MSSIRCLILTLGQVSRVTEHLAVTIATASGGNINKGEVMIIFTSRGKEVCRKEGYAPTLAPRVGDFVEWSDVFGKAKVLSVTHQFNKDAEVRAVVDVDFADVPHLSPGA